MYICICNVCMYKTQLLKNFLYIKINLKFKELLPKIFFAEYETHIYTVYMFRT